MSACPSAPFRRALRVDQSFVVTQSKLLEKKNLLRRKSSTEDARVVNLSLTEHAKKQMANLSSQRRELNEFVYAEPRSARAACNCRQDGLHQDPPGKSDRQNFGRSLDR